MKNSTILLVAGAALAYLVARRTPGGGDVGSGGTDVAVSAPGVSGLLQAAQASSSPGPSPTPTAPTITPNAPTYRAPTGGGSSLGIIVAKPGQYLSTISGTVRIPSAAANSSPLNTPASVSTALGTVFSKPKPAATLPTAIRQKAIATDWNRIFKR